MRKWHTPLILFSVVCMVDNLKIEYDINRQANVSTHPDPVLWAIETFKYQPNIFEIKEYD